MRTSLILASTLTALAAAADPGTTTISYFGIGQEGGANIAAYTSTAARVVGIDKYATTYEITCEKDAKKCAFPAPATLIQGENTYSISVAAVISTGGATAHATAIESCTFKHYSESVSCAWTLDYKASMDGITQSTKTSGTTSIPAAEVTYLPLAVTDGVYALTADATASETAVKVTPTASHGGAGALARPLVTAAPLGAAVAALVGML
ncbi:hypothetical protein N7535_004702 [Penicillium sp. DV-2018c]|nr:hypothetical protein N7461_008284 [Penicillium sp. DV-2018c]KAJ5571042.1 hypothetical protein N7535_004702 [Penicillium sp. DV-2018c]